MQSPTVEAITRGLYDERVAVRHHAMRRTLWVMTPDVAQAAHAGFARKIAVAERRRTAVIFGEDATWVADGIERVVDAVRAAERIQAFVGDTRFSVRFPSPNQPALLA